MDRVSLRLAVGDFVHTKIGESFQHYHKQHLKLLEWHHEYHNSLMTLKGSDGKNYHYIVPAVYKLIQHLHDNGERFNVVIRTYGLDCENVLNSLQHSISTKQHPLFPRLPDLQLRPAAGNIFRHDGNGIELQVGGTNHITQKSIYPFIDGDTYRFHAIAG